MADVTYIRDYLPIFEVVEPHKEPAEVIVLPMLRMEREAIRRKYLERASSQRPVKS